VDKGKEPFYQEETCFEVGVREELHCVWWNVVCTNLRHWIRWGQMCIMMGFYGEGALVLQGCVSYTHYERTLSKEWNMLFAMPAAWGKCFFMYLWWKEVKKGQSL
jgi:hypothetical protein